VTEIQHPQTANECAVTKNPA